jgi:hypothetical protein
MQQNVDVQAVPKQGVSVNVAKKQGKQLSMYHQQLLVGAKVEDYQSQVERKEGVEMAVLTTLELLFPRENAHRMGCHL